MSREAFRPTKNTNSYVVSVTTTTSTGVQTTGGCGPECQYRISNTGSQRVWANYSLTSDVTVVIPVNGTPAKGFGIAAGAVEVFTAPANAYWAFITSTSTSSVEINTGEGI